MVVRGVGVIHRLGARPTRTVRGEAGALLAWLIGRGAGDGLTVDPAGPLPRLPDWK